MWQPAKVLKMCNTLAVRVCLGFIETKSGRGVIRNPDNQSRFFRCISALLIVAICSCLVLPLPVTDAVISSRLSGKDSSVPFPCMRKPCGCRSAEECWRKCCCFSHKQKLAWAEENGVKVPDYVLEAAEEELKSDQSAAGVLAKQSSGESGMKAGNCGTCQTTEDSRSLIAGVLSMLGLGDTAYVPKAASSCCSPEGAMAGSAADQTGLDAIRFVSTVQALECNGISLAMAVLSQIYLTESESVVTGGVLPDYVLLLNSDRLNGVISGPPVPPPRLCGV